MYNSSTLARELNWVLCFTSRFTLYNAGSKVKLFVVQEVRVCAKREYNLLILPETDFYCDSILLRNVGKFLRNYVVASQAMAFFVVTAVIT